MLQSGMFGAEQHPLGFIKFLSGSLRLLRVHRSSVGPGRSQISSRNMSHNSASVVSRTAGRPIHNHHEYRRPRTAVLTDPHSHRHTDCLTDTEVDLSFTHNPRRQSVCFLFSLLPRHSCPGSTFWFLYQHARAEGVANGAGASFLVFALLPGAGVHHSLNNTQFI